VLVGHGGAVAVPVVGGLRDVLWYTAPVLDVIEPNCGLVELIPGEDWVIIPPDDAGEEVDIPTAGDEVDIPTAVDNAVDEVDIGTTRDELDTTAVVDDVLPGCVEDVK
jgi:hypothetical protein